MAQDSPKNTANEKQLFHGTSSNLVDAVCKQNFDWRMRAKHGKKYGEGSYFAIQASCSHCYTERDVNGDYFMFLAGVLVGLYIEGEPTYRRPPLKDPTNPASDLYDSCVDNQCSPTIFVVFDMDQCYPEYVIRYLKLEKCPTSQAQNDNPQVNQLLNPGMSSRLLSSNKALPSSTTSVLRSNKAPGDAQVTEKLANPGGSSELLSSNKALPSSTTSVLRSNKALGDAQVTEKLANPERPSELLSSNKALPSSTTSVRRPTKAPGDAQVTEKLANSGRSSGLLSSNKALPSSTTSVLRSNKALGDAQVTEKLANPERPSELLSSNKALPSSTTSVRRPTKAPGDAQVTEKLANSGRSSGLLSSNKALPSSTTSVGRSTKALGDAQVTEQLANPGRSSGRFSSNIALVSSAVKRPITFVAGNHQVNPTNQKQSCSLLSGYSQSVDPKGPAGGLNSNRELSARFSNLQYPGKGPGDSRGNTTTPGGSSTWRISNKTSGSNGRHNSKNQNSNCCSCLIL